MSIPVTTYSMITNLVDGGDPVVAGTLYKFNLDMMTGTATVGESCLCQQTIKSHSLPITSLALSVHIHSRKVTVK